MSLEATSDFPSYFYTPQALLASYRKLKQDEEDLKQQEEQQEKLLEASTFDNNTSAGRLVVAAVQLTTPPIISFTKTSSSSSSKSTTVVDNNLSESQQNSTSAIPENHQHSNVDSFWIAAQQAVEQAAARGATVILLPELFLGPYFCQSQDYDLMVHLAVSVEDSFMIRRMLTMARQYQVVLPISIYEKKNTMRYNSVVMIDADGSLLGTYRKSHIPDGPGYQEKFYFSPGDSGVHVFSTRYGKIGVAICWDQWFPEVARILALQGAQVILYPTAIGSEPQEEAVGTAPASSADHWQRVMQGHAAANMIPVVAANRYGTEVLLDHDTLKERQRIHFYGRSFITDETGAIVQQAKDDGAADILILEIDTRKQDQRRSAWGLFRDRRPDLYGLLQTKDGV